MPAKRKRSTGGKWKYARLFLALQAQQMPSIQRHIWHLLWLYCEWPSRRVRLSQQYIADCIGKSRRAVQMAMADMVDTGVIKVLYKGRKNHDSTIYKLTAVSEDCIERAKSVTELHDALLTAAETGDFDRCLAILKAHNTGSVYTQTGEIIDTN